MITNAAPTPRLVHARQNRFGAAIRSMNARPRFVWTVVKGPWSRTELGTSPRRERKSATAEYAASPTSTHRSVFIVGRDGLRAKRRVGLWETAPARGPAGGRLPHPYCGVDDSFRAVISSGASR